MILPAVCVIRESRHDLDAAAWPQEALPRNVVEHRRREAVTVRELARLALDQLGYPRRSIPRDERGAPVWPDGIVGSMTHCDGFRASAVAERRCLRSLGIDAEPNERLPDETRSLVASPEEIAHIDRMAVGNPQVAWDKLLFSAKESVYKAWYPLTGRWLDFANVRVDFDVLGTFIAIVLTEAPIVDGHSIHSFDGAWAVNDDLLVTAAWVVLG